MRITCQEQLLPGDTMLQKWDAARRFGFDGIELRGQGGHRIRGRLPELRQARAAGVVMTTVCVEMLHFIGDFDAGRRRDAVENMRTQLSVIAELGGIAAMTPASYGMFSRRLPPFTPPRDEAGDREVLLDALGELGRHAESEGVKILLEPLNRYEDHMVNRLEQAVELADATGLTAVGVVADAYHMNIEETLPSAALEAAAHRLAHVQVSDSNRLEPGAGHLDWEAFVGALARIGYTGDLAAECRLSGPAEQVLPRAVATLRRAGAASG
ncbi:sugar phosphate isomerase/epimerase family protein [Pseudonocardia sp. TRM90224]|uniref:sugar phosphate isomerase/epimerase family protein n=1 Tax=Pseudonocardia sp. TRM90224 TaxID=2812678 RepID=UPI001E3D3800|nr:sugar phosphate isomerase/epimerase family protein [Pseudonocardia sp. TRM90224]